VIVNNKLDKISCKDLGAGGVVCASVEQVVDLGFGADIQIDNVHVGLEGLPAEVIACAETQERLCITCHPELTDHILKHFNEVWDLPSVAENARASLIGKVTTDGIYRATYKGEVICEASAEALTCGLQYTRPTEAQDTSYIEPEISCEGSTITTQDQSFSLQEIFETMIGHPNYASKSPAFRHFDKNVIGNTIIEAGEADASVIAPLQDLQSHVHEGEHPGWELSEDDRWTGVAIAGDGNGRYGRISAYWQGVNATLESMRNVVAVGGTPRALTDCLNYGNPEIPEQLAELEQGVQGIADVAKTIHFEGEPVPVISGNVSLYNGKPDGSSIDPTAIVSTTGVLKDARKAVTMQLKKEDSVIVLIGTRKRELGGSAYYTILEEMTNSNTDTLLGNSVPKPDLTEANAEMVDVLDLIKTGTVRACHDISDGGIALALFEMTLPQRKRGGKIGLDISLGSLDEKSDTLLFSETGGFLLEMSPEDAEKAGLSTAIIGKTTPDASLKISRNNNTLIQAKLSDLTSKWENGLYSVL